MEVQSLVLCKELQKVGGGNEYNGELICVHSFYSIDGQFPLEFRIPYYMLLRRDSRGDGEEVSLGFNLIDFDGKKIGTPNDFKAVGQFPAGHMFMSLSGTIAFSFPEIGDYILSIIADDGMMPTEYQYHIEITEKP